MVSQIDSWGAEALRQAVRTCFPTSLLRHDLVAGKTDTWLRKESDAITYEISKGVSGFLLQNLFSHQRIATLKWQNYFKKV